jgi:hypothetical protein
MPQKGVQAMHWPCAVHVLAPGQVPHDPLHPSGPQLRPAHCGEHEVSATVASTFASPFASIGAEASGALGTASSGATAESFDPSAMGTLASRASSDARAASSAAGPTAEDPLHPRRTPAAIASKVRTEHLTLRARRIFRPRPLPGDHPGGAGVPVVRVVHVVASF